MSVKRRQIMNTRPKKIYEPEANHAACSANASGGEALRPPPQPPSSFFLKGLPPLQGQPAPHRNVSTSNWNHRKKIIPKIFPHPIFFSGLGWCPPHEPDNHTAHFVEQRNWWWWPQGLVVIEYRKPEEFLSGSVCSLLTHKIFIQFTREISKHQKLLQVWDLLFATSHPWVIHLALCLHLFQALADALSINKTITELHLGDNQIGDNGMKVWWVERCGASRGSCVWEWMDEHHMDTPIRLVIGTYLYTWCPSFEISKHHKSSHFKFGIRVFLAWTPLVLKWNRFLASILSFNFQCRWNAFWNNNLWFLFCHGSSDWRSAFHLFQALADALSINKTITELRLSGNEIGDNGMKVWWVERCGASRGSCVWEWMDPGWDLWSINWSRGKSADLIRGFMVEPWTFSGFSRLLDSLQHVMKLLGDALLAISSRSWPMRCASTKPSQIFTSTTTRLVMRESRPGGRSGRIVEDHREHRDPMELFQWFHTCNHDEFGAQSK